MWSQHREIHLLSTSLSCPSPDRLYLFVTTVCIRCHLQGTVLYCQKSPGWLWGGWSLHVVRLLQIWSQFRAGWAGRLCSTLPCRGRPACCVPCAPYILRCSSSVSKCHCMAMPQQTLVNKSNVTELAMIHVIFCLVQSGSQWELFSLDSPEKRTNAYC